jgi:cytoskeletal protein RodZ
MEKHKGIGLGQLAGLAVLGWVGYILWKNHSLTKGIDDIKGRLKSVENKVQGVVQGNTSTPTTNTTVLTPNSPQWDAFIAQPANMATINPFENFVKNKSLSKVSFE